MIQIGSVRYISEALWHMQEAHDVAERQLLEELGKALVTELLMHKERRSVSIKRVVVQPREWDDDSQQYHRAPSVVVGSIALKANIWRKDEW